MAVIVQSTLNSDVYANSELNAHFLSFLLWTECICTFTSEINDYYYYLINMSKPNERGTTQCHTE